MPTVESLEAVVLRHAAADPRFVGALRRNPHAALKSALDIDLDTSITVRVVERQVDEIVLVLPQGEPQAPLLPADAAPFAGTNISANSGCHQCCKPH